MRVAIQTCSPEGPMRNAQHDARRPAHNLGNCPPCRLHSRKQRGDHPDGIGYRSMSYRSVLGRAGRLANALRGLGITADQRVATFQWSNQEHLEAYCAVPPWARCCTPSTFVWLQSNSRTSPTMPAIRSSWWMRRLRHCWLVRYQRWSRCIRSSPPGRRPRSAAAMREDGVALRGDPGAATGDFRLARDR